MLKTHLLFLWLTLALLSGLASAHPMPSSVLLLDIHETTITAELQIPLSELGLALKIDLLGNSAEALATYDAQLRTYLTEHIQPVTAGGQPWTVQVDGIEIFSAEQTATGPYQELIAHLMLSPPPGTNTDTFSLHYDAVIHQVVTHTALVSVRQDWANGLTEQQAVEVGVIRYDPVDGNIKPLEVDRAGGSWLTGFSSMFKLGMSHIREGTDHLLFLLALLLAAPLFAHTGRWQGFAGTRRAARTILGIVTAFTVGHSLTLIRGTLLHLELPAQPIEALIAVSIIVSAVHALRPLFPQREVLMAGIFGLIHGLAFSFTLAELKLSTRQMALSLLGFNLGIEVMQLLLIALVIPWLVLLARTAAYAPVRVAGALVAALAALGWLVERLGYANILSSVTNGMSRYGPWVIVAIVGLALVGYVIKRNLAFVRPGKG